VDYIYRHLPQPAPDSNRLHRRKIIAHRGVFDNSLVLENTLAAFDQAQRLGIWGIELDVRWTRDLVPVVFHDPDTRRLYRTDTRISQTTFAQLATQFPQIPTLENVVQRYGQRLHLMIEIKPAPWADAEPHFQALQEPLAGLVPGRDFHLISMTPQLFRSMGFVPADTFLPIAQLNIAQCSRLAIQYDYGGLLGHYALIRDAVVERHRDAGQLIGTGFINSFGCLFRELNRNVEWLFTDQAALLQAECRSYFQHIQKKGAEHASR
jgi:glycerophosphoryl diester phosphodiesterase